MHANLGSWLEQQQEQHRVPILATPTAHPASVLFFGKAAVSSGALTVVLVVSTPYASSMSTACTYQVTACGVSVVNRL